MSRIVQVSDNGFQDTQQTELGKTLGVWKGTPSKWITFDALRVVRRVYEARGSLSIDELELVHR